MIVCSILWRAISSQIVKSLQIVNFIRLERSITSLTLPIIGVHFSEVALSLSLSLKTKDKRDKVLLKSNTAMNIELYMACFAFRIVFRLLSSNDIRLFHDKCGRKEIITNAYITCYMANVQLKSSNSSMFSLQESYFNCYSLSIDLSFKNTFPKAAIANME